MNRADGEGVSAVLVDLDGTLALRNGRSPYDWGSVSDDLVNEPVVRVIQTLADSGLRVLVVSGRDEVCRNASEAWLNSNLRREFALFMRPQGDNRRDEELKRDIWEQHIRDRYVVTAAFDDRNRCVALWRNLGIPTFQVADGDF